MKTTFVHSSGASAQTLEALQVAYPSLPTRYLQLLELMNGAEGDLAVEPGWFVVWSADQAQHLNGLYEVTLYLPDHFAFGSNGAGELFTFELHGARADRTVFAVPAVAMIPTELRVLSQSLAELQGYMGKAFRNEA